MWYTLRVIIFAGCNKVSKRLIKCSNILIQRFCILQTHPQSVQAGTPPNKLISTLGFLNDQRIQLFEQNGEEIVHLSNLLDSFPIPHAILCRDTIQGAVQVCLQYFIRWNTFNQRADFILTQQAQAICIRQDESLEDIVRF